jgi:hypothetical protein
MWYKRIGRRKRKSKEKWKAFFFAGRRKSTTLLEGSLALAPRPCDRSVWRVRCWSDGRWWVKSETRNCNLLFNVEMRNLETWEISQISGFRRRVIEAFALLGVMQYILVVVFGDYQHNAEWYLWTLKASTWKLETLSESAWRQRKNKKNKKACVRMAGHRTFRMHTDLKPTVH